MDEQKHRKALIRGYLDLALSSISIMAVIISLIVLSFLRWDLPLCLSAISKDYSHHGRESKTVLAWIPVSRYWIPDSFSAELAFSIQSLVKLWIPWAVFRFHAKPRISDLNSTSTESFPNSLIRIPSRGATTSFPGFSPTRPTEREREIYGSVGRVGENPGNEVGGATHHWVINE